jgi:hypothetical protein
MYRQELSRYKRAEMISFTYHRFSESLKEEEFGWESAGRKYPTSLPQVNANAEYTFGIQPNLGNSGKGGKWADEGPKP